MRPFIVGIGGAHSRVGKTSVACKILQRLSGWGAIKYTKTVLYSAIVDTPEILQEKNKDTSRLLEAGAKSVLWVQSPPENLREVLEIAIERLSYVKGIILEGNSAIEVLKPDIVLFISGNDGIKKGAEKILSMADAVIFSENPPPETPGTAKRFRLDEEKYISFVLRRIHDSPIFS